MPTTRQTRSNSAKERKLLEEIQRRPPLAVRRRFEALIRKREDEIISEKEMKELIHLTDQAEERMVERLKCLVELARLRGTTLPALMDDLGIKAPSHE